MNLPNKVKDAVRRLGNDSDYTTLLTYLKELREERLSELEDCNADLQSHKLQGYCQALRDLIKLHP